MDYKLVCCDLDGTILRNDKTISLNTMNALKQADEKGIHVVFASGRSLEGVKKIWDMIGMRGYSICYNGNLVSDDQGNLWENGYDIKEFKVLCEFLELHKIPAFFSLKDYDYLSIDILNKGDGTWLRNYKLIENYQYSDLCDLDEVIFKISLNIEDEQIVDDIKMLVKTLEIGLVKAEEAIYDVVLDHHQKEDGLKYLAKTLNIHRGNILCIGDNENDISMLLYAGLGVAMKNATENVKEIADFIGETNENDGVYKILCQFVL